MKIQTNVSLKSSNTFQIDAMCREVISIESIDDVRSAEFAKYIGENKPRYILGQGSNVLLLNDLDVPVIKLDTQGWTVLSETDQRVLIKVQGGQDWHEFVIAMAQQNYWGVENLALIPGTVGASPMQNIGAYGVELSNVFVRADVLDMHSGEIRHFNKTACEFAYRDSFFKKYNQNAKALASSASSMLSSNISSIAPPRFLILNVVFELSKQANPQLGYSDLKQRVESKALNAPVSATLIAETVIEIRQSKLPNWHELGCAGSFFKNPVVDATVYQRLYDENIDMPAYPSGGAYKIPAGWLIEQAGWKGYKDGDAGVYEKQALVLVNHDNATGAEIKALAQRICESVKQKFGVELEQEVIEFT